MIVLNLASGPGAQPDAAFFPALDRLRSAGVTVAGYVDTNYGHRPADDAMAELARYWTGTRSTGCSSTGPRRAAEDVGHYADLAGRARDTGARLVAFNHGAHPVEAYADHADLLGTFEGPWTAYLELAVPRWVRSRPAGQFFHLLHSVPVASFGDAAWLAARRNAGAALRDRPGRRQSLGPACPRRLAPGCRYAAALPGAYPANGRNESGVLKDAGKPGPSRQAGLRPRLAVLRLVLAGVLLLAAGAVAVRLVTESRSGCQEAFVPAYFYPGADWTRRSPANRRPAS